MPLDALLKLLLPAGQFFTAKVQLFPQIRASLLILANCSARLSRRLADRLPRHACAWASCVWLSRRTRS